MFGTCFIRLMMMCDSGRRSRKKCCCSWYDCREISKALKGRDDTWGTGDFVVVIMKEEKNKRSNKQIRLSENWCRNLQCKEMSSYIVARHHFPKSLLTAGKKWTTPLSTSEAEAFGITGVENMFTDKSGALDEARFVRAPVITRSSARAAAKMARERFTALEISSAMVGELKELFFSVDGTLRSSLVDDFDNSKQSGHGFITLEQEDTKDLRWMLPFKAKQSEHTSSTFTDVERIVGNFINLKEEKLHGIVLIVGGTKDQPIHHDVARKFTDGYETVEDALRYYHDMESPYAPSSILIDMSERDEVLLGVQRDQVYHVRSDWRKCTIANSGPMEYEIIRETEHIVVIAVPFGCMFTGDFKHAGVCNVNQNSEDYALLERLMSELVPVLTKKSHKKKMKAALDVLMKCKGIQSLCRFHCCTEKIGGKFSVGSNTVGYTGCKEKEPDGM